MSIHCRVFPIVFGRLAVAAGLLCAVGRVSVLAEPEVGSAGLAVLLAREGKGETAALEFRRLAMDADGPEQRDGLFWAAAHQYWKAGQPELAEKMLDRSEDAHPGPRLSRSLLRGETAMSAGQPGEAGYHWQGLLEGDAPADYREYAARRLAIARLQKQDVSSAEAALRAAPQPDPHGLEALQRYRQGKDKSPKLGGVLGILPGCGYFYSGEYANGFRSIILNGLFLWGMASTADREQWGFFGVITFAEFTWYSGSIYGGIDAAGRYNRARVEECETSIMGDASFEPDWAKLPLIQLNFTF